ncbi:uracil-DNA glycosylase [Halorientalis halophila]|uniref:uracil-DNA glycosylase n=1 Tax=Halorientalis halophila TaxID=3108499 RepID=UPI0030096E33
MPPFPDPDEREPLADDCRRCPALVEGRECISWGNGPLDADLVVVGEAPGYGDPDADRWRGGNWTGLAYTSRHSGRRVRDLLADAGYGHENCYFTNAVKCFPADPEDPTTNREPTAEERENCRPYLREEIETVAPSVVVTTGTHATQSVFAMAGHEVDGFLDAVLEPVPWPALETTVLPLLHPSYQDVWLSRFGYSRREYVDAIRQTIRSV